MRRSLALLALMSPLLPLAAQSAPAADSAAVARKAWGQAIAALRAGDAVEAQRLAAHAASAWPVQPAYIWGRAAISARTGDSLAVREALTDYAAFGLGRSLGDSIFDRYRQASWFATLAAAHATNAAPAARSVVRATFADSTFWPEGVDYDPRSRTFYVAGIRHRAIVAVSADGSQRTVISPDRPEYGAMFGVRVDPREPVLWVTTSGAPQMAGYAPRDSQIAALLKIRIADGRLLRRWDLPVGQHVLGDLAVAPDGTVYMTDSQEPVLYVLLPGAHTLRAFRHPLFRSLQGMAPSPDPLVVYVADYSHGLLRVDTRDGSATRLEMPAHVTSVGCDGIVRVGNSIVAVQNGVAPARVVRFDLDESGTRITGMALLDRNSDVADEPTIGTVAGNDFVYVATSQWEKHDESGVRNRVPLRPAVLLAVPLRP